MFVYPRLVPGLPSPAAAATTTFVRQEARVLDQLAELTAMYGSYGAAWIMFSGE